MIRKIIHIDQEKCNGCGACAAACHEGAIGMVGGKATLLRDDYCDGLGDCLPACPTGAISFVHREAAEYDEKAVLAHKKAHTGCPGNRLHFFNHVRSSEPEAGAQAQPSALQQWPCQIRLVPVNAPYFRGADLLIAADCTAFACATVHRDFMEGKITLIGCPKLDSVDYSEKLGDILRTNDIRSISVLRMEVPCCGGLSNAVRKALEASGKNLPLTVTTLSIDGRILN